MGISQHFEITELKGNSNSINLMAGNIAETRVETKIDISRSFDF